MPFSPFDVLPCVQYISFLFPVLLLEALSNSICKLSVCKILGHTADVRHHTYFVFLGIASVRSLQWNLWRGSPLVRIPRRGSSLFSFSVLCPAEVYSLGCLAVLSCNQIPIFAVEGRGVTSHLFCCCVPCACLLASKRILRKDFSFSLLCETISCLKALKLPGSWNAFLFHCPDLSIYCSYKCFQGSSTIQTGDSWQPMCKGFSVC